MRHRTRRLFSYPVRSVLAAACAVAAAVAATARGQAIVRGVDDPETPEPESLVLPYAFYTSSTDLAFGVGGGATGVLQPQSFLGAAAFGSANGSFGFYFIGRDLQLADRLFLDATSGITRFAENEEYVDGDPRFPGEAGANDSDENDFVRSETLGSYIELPFKYVLPIGAGRRGAIATYTLDRGTLKEGATGATSWDPLRSGRTTLNLTPFGQWRTLDVADETPVDRDDYNTTGLRLGVRWDNTDFPANPTRGNTVFAQVSRDFGSFDSFSQYTTLEFNYAHHIPLGTSEWFRQQVLSLDFWTTSALAGETPFYTGATLGGYRHLRGYSFNRFHGDSAVLATAELRLMPDYNPVADLEALDRLARVDWLQLVLFAEAGRVADSYSAELLDDLKWDVGVGVRMMVRKSVVRADLAFGEEGGTLWLMVGQPF